MKTEKVVRGLVCLHCSWPRLWVVYTRPGEGGVVVRRRECGNCGKRVTTREKVIGLG
jgi:transcriptional regulator NrdR family protein